jgi:hypothetical protein
MLQKLCAIKLRTGMPAELLRLSEEL